MSRPAPPRSPATPLASVVLLLATLATLAVVLTATGGGAAAATRAAPLADTRADPTSTPLAVSIVTLAPGTIPQRGRVTVTGRITNRSQDTWTDLNVYLLTSPEPLRSRAQLATAAASDSDAPVGGRVTGSGLYDRVGDLAPGATAGYRLSVRRADLGISGRPGVYWVGVHVLGSDPDGRDTVADGRARTFMPLVPRPGTQAAARARTRLALLMPVRKPVQRGSQGRLVDPAGWDSVLAPRGRLTRLLGLSGRARGALTWVLDPALLEAVSSVARGNPALDVVAGSDDTAGPSARPPTSPGPPARGWPSSVGRRPPMP